MHDPREDFLKMLIANQKTQENKTFGEFIVQSNEVQFYLFNLVLLNSAFPDKAFIQSLERAELGTLINLFCACSDKGWGVIITKLRKYQKDRNRLAHKMHSSKKLTKKECEISIKDGEFILKALKIFLETRLEKTRK